MGTKYSGVSVAGYNATPPADDGTQTASNLVKWSTHKTKLGDPLNTAIAAINTAVIAALDASCRAISSADSSVAADNNKTLQVTGTTTISLGDAATMGAGYTTNVVNAGTNTVTVGLVTAADTLSGTANGTISLPPKQSVRVVVNAAANGYNVTSPTPTYGTLATTFTFNGSGGTSGSVTLTWQKVGNFVTLNIPAVTATSGTGSTEFDSDTALPTAVRPTANQDAGSIPLTNNASALAAPGFVRVNTNGTLSIFRDNSQAAYSNGATAGVRTGTSISYFTG